MLRKTKQAWQEKLIYWIMWARIVSQITIIIGFIIFLFFAMKSAGVI